jgi:alkanesulfonate monooxygenase SsuD/methylene tetrahydromethanopterin reductase-like flavin-dependent oxidoreductase (luciferase family)
VDFDLFCSISQTPVEGYLPDEQTLLHNFLRQAEAADELGYGTVWVAESHYSTQLQKTHRKPVVPHWQGEIGLNTDICQLAAQVFARTRRLGVGSAIMNIVCNGGPLPAAERVATAVSWHGLDPQERRPLSIGFSGGRFDYINRLTGVDARTEWEELAWPQVRRALVAEAAEIFVRLLTGEAFSSDDVPEAVLGRADLGDDESWAKVRAAAGCRGDELRVPRRWTFERTAIVPAQWRRDLLRLVLGSHDPDLQIRVNRIAPVRVFNLSITPPEIIEATHERMRRHYHPAGGPWRRGYLPRTSFVFLNADPTLTPERQRQRAHDAATAVLSAYWQAMEGTIDPARVRRDVSNALIGNPDDVAEQIAQRFHPDDRLMLWFDFFDHDCDRVIAGMRATMTEVVPRLAARGITVNRQSQA